MPDKIIFLDIDGPMIPGTDYLFNKYCSFQQKLNPQCVDVLKLILGRSGAKIVFNTTHNTMLEPYSDKYGKFDTPGLIARFKEVGFTESDFHEDCHTIYPGVDRLTAINEWLSRNKTDQMLWVALDDTKIEHKRAILVDFNAGLTLREYNEAAKLLMFKSYMVL